MSAVHAALLTNIAPDTFKQIQQNFWSRQTGLDCFESTFVKNVLHKICGKRGEPVGDLGLPGGQDFLTNPRMEDVLDLMGLRPREILNCSSGLLNPAIPNSSFGNLNSYVRAAQLDDPNYFGSSSISKLTTDGALLNIDLRTTFSTDHVIPRNCRSIHQSNEFNIRE